mgnify:CR=1 FL=1
MLNKLQAVVNKFEELCFKSEQPDFYADPKKAAIKLSKYFDTTIVKLDKDGCLVRYS